MKKITIILLSVLTLLFSSCVQNEDDEFKEDNNVIDRTNNKNQQSQENYINPLVNNPIVNDDLYNEENLEKIKYIETVLSEFKTELNDKNKNRVHNIKLACDKITGMQIHPGEVFSFNETVGKANSQNGFKMSKVVINKELKPGIGGGICQVSTTVFNAADRAGLEIVEVHNHSKDVPYIEKGRDATVAYGSQDFKFKNNLSNTIKIDVSLEGNILQCKIIELS